MWGYNIITPRVYHKKTGKWRNLACFRCVADLYNTWQKKRGHAFCVENFIHKIYNQATICPSFEMKHPPMELLCTWSVRTTSKS